MMPVTDEKGVKCGCKLDSHGRLLPLNMCPTHHIQWEAFHKSAAEQHRVEQSESERRDLANAGRGHLIGP